MREAHYLLRSPEFVNNKPYFLFVNQMWSVEYVQIPDISNSKRSSATNIGQLTEDLAVVKITQSKNEDSESDNESNSSDSAVCGSNASSPARGSIDRRMSDSSPEGLDGQDVLSPDSGKQTGTPGTSQEGSPADNIAQGGSTGHPGGPWKLNPPQRNISGGKRSPEGNSSTSQPESSNHANNGGEVCNSNYINERTRGQQSGSNANNQLGSSDYEGSQDERSLCGSLPSDNQSVGHPVGSLDLKTPSPLLRGEYVLVTENDLANMPEEIKKKEGDSLSAAHRNKLKPGNGVMKENIFLIYLD